MRAVACASASKQDLASTVTDATPLRKGKRAISHT
ncbi:hypothetical protein QF025_002684 [Paraburkholderia graminis]|uniref:Uncharacterized protein n=1 Tax=Paraburkholderia graminis TaxID=60548 RepID=A0ABD5CFE3_9BURK|nr:hypothetical protein [Paraburkholderia graminis]